MNTMDFAIKNWDNPAALKTLIGQRGESDARCFGAVPTDKVQIDAVDGVIVRVRTWSGLSWSAKGGRGTPLVDVQ